MRTMLTLAAFTLFGVLAANPAHAGAKSARQALTELRDGRKPYDKVQNRFFLKEGRFEIAPILGTVPNNPMVRRFTGGVLGAYHFSETFAVEGAFIYSPDLGTSDLKGLVNTLVLIASTGAEEGDPEFQQPVDKIALGASFAARWAPLYGKINLIGEQVLNFDFYGIAGMGLLTINKYYARPNENATSEEDEPTVLDVNAVEPIVAGNIGLGINFFVSQSVAVKLDARSYLYIDTLPQYDPDVLETEQRLYNAFITSAGVSVFFPKMKPRLTDF
ncbi:MAG: outer membrane beta-barrel domain-containing protein [Myxococcota bacterium]